MQKKILFILLFLSFKLVHTQNHVLSNQAEISVLTIGPGTSLNDAFGHSAFRVKDTSLGIDVTYGYGEYDFDTPHFYLKFAQGKLNYLISKIDFKLFYQAYSHYYNRTIKEQVLNLSAIEKQTLYNYLLNNYKPENRAYLYDFFFDNCATKIKDVTNIAVNNSITFHKPNGLKDVSFRTLIQNNLNKNSWGSLGIDIALGSVIDRKANPNDHMFLPENIHDFFQIATIHSSNMPLVKKSHTLYSQRGFAKSDVFLTSPLFVFGMIGLIILFITVTDYKNKKQSKWIDITIFSITGLVGIFILLLWFATNHKGTHYNYNLLWAFALNSLVISQFFKKRVSAWFIKYLKFLIILLCLLVMHWLIGVQVFALAIIPLLIALLIRYVYLVNYFKKIG